MFKFKVHSHDARAKSKIDTTLNMILQRIICQYYQTTSLKQEYLISHSPNGFAKNAKLRVLQNYQVPRTRQSCYA